MNKVLAHWNQLPEEDAAQEILPCCGSVSWARRLVSRRPIEDEQSLASGSDEIWNALTSSDWREAFSKHPRIGELDLLLGCHNSRLFLGRPGSRRTVESYDSRARGPVRLGGGQPSVRASLWQSVHCVCHRQVRQRDVRDPAPAPGER